MAKQHTAVILTALYPEFISVLQQLEKASPAVGVYSRRDYRDGTFRRHPSNSNDIAPWRILLHEAGRDQHSALKATEDAMRDWSPDAILFVGVAGGRPGKTRHFEVLVAKEIVYYETAKITADGLRQWYQTHENQETDIFRAARIERDEVDTQGMPIWVSRVLHSKIGNSVGALGLLPQLRARMAPIASGEKVITDPQSPQWREVERSAYRIEAVETEGHGFACARCVDALGRPIPRLMIRGISDMLADKNTAEASMPSERLVVGNHIGPHNDNIERSAFQVEGMSDDERQLIAATAAAAFALQTLIRFSDSFLLNTDKDTRSSHFEEIVIRIDSKTASNQELKAGLTAVLEVIETLGAKTVVLELKIGSLTAKIRADAAAIVLLRALKSSGLLERIAGGGVNILEEMTSGADVPQDIMRCADAIANLSAAPGPIQGAAIAELSHLATNNPTWRSVTERLVALVTASSAVGPSSFKDQPREVEKERPAAGFGPAQSGAGRFDDFYRRREHIEFLIGENLREPKLFDACLQLGHRRLFFAPSGHRLRSRASKISDILRTQRLDRIPSRKQITDFTRTMPMTLTTILRIDDALRHIATEMREMEVTDVGGVPFTLQAGSVVPSIIGVDGTQLAETRNARGLTRSELSIQMFGPGRRNTLARLEDDKSGMFRVTFDTARRIAELLDDRVENVITDPLARGDAREVRALLPSEGNIITGDR